MSALLRGIGGGISAVAAVVATIAVVTAIGFGVWWFGVRTSGVVGTGQITKDQNSSQNREYWSAKYSADWQQLQADQANLTALKADATGPGATQQDRMNLEGAQLNCRQDAATYNTDTANVLGRQWLPAAQPTTVTANTFCGS